MNDRNLVLSKEEREYRRAGYAELDRKELDRQAVAAILEHRRLIEADEIIYGEWVLAADDNKTPATVVRALQEQYVLRQQKSLCQQEMLEDMLDVLGYIPDTGD